MATNTLYYGDNLKVLRQYLADKSVDLVYLDPPFNSNQDYNVLFKERDGTRSAAQVKAFKDTWYWDDEASRAYHETVARGGRVSDFLQAFHTFLGFNDMLAYLSMMAERLIELHRVLKDTGSIYLHCDPTASHYLKLLMDAVFGPTSFRNEITWKRTYSHGNVGRNYGSICDKLLFYSKTQSYTWNQQYVSFPQGYVESTFKYQDSDGRRWQSVTLRNPGPRPNLHYPYTASNGITYHPHPNGWACEEARLRRYDEEGRLHFPSSPTGALRLKMYLDENPGPKAQNLWDDIQVIGSQSTERLGYPTQKPEALLERIIRASSNEGDLVLDPFCGCGTTVAVAQHLDRRWIGIDVTCLAINLMRRRLEDRFRGEADYEVIGEPTAYSEARQLAAENPYQFEYWALDLVGARPVGPKKGADKGVDGEMIFFDDESGAPKRAVFSVKAGKLQAHYVRDLRGVIERERAVVGCLISLEDPTKPMKAEAAEAGLYTSPLGNKTHPRLQLVTVKDLLEGKKLKLPEMRHDITFARAPRARKKAKQGSLEEAGEGEG